MRSLAPAALALALALALPNLAGPRAAAADGPATALDAGKALLAEGDRLADESKTTDAEIRYQQGMEKLLPGIRRLEFKHEVKRDVTPREKIRDYLVRELEEERSPEEFRAEELALKAFGLIPADLDYKETVLTVYTEEIGAFYDPKTKTMHLISEKGPGRKPGLLESLLGRRAGFSKEESKTVIAHELTHALADQHYDLDRMLKSIKDDDDRELALSALIEGEATLTMMAAQMGDWEGRETALLPAEQLGTVFNIMMPMLRFASGAALRSAPPIVAESMLFPYIRGLVFCAHQTNEGGWAALDEVYKNPPLSTEQVLHPAKYKAEPDPPTAVDLGPLDPGPDWTERGRNVLGELQTSVLLRGFDARAASEGWDGDQYAVFEGPEGRVGLVWLTTWDSESDAREFARAYARYRAARLGLPAPDPDSDSVRLAGAGATFALSRRGADVAVVEGFPEPAVPPLLEAAHRASKSEKTHGE